MSVNPIPTDYHRITPYLMLPNVAKLIEFTENVFSASVTEKHVMPGGRIMHAQIKIGDSTIMMGEPMGEWKPMPGSIYVYVEDCDAVYKKALEAGAQSVMEPADQFYGDRNAGVKDPHGNIWWLATRIENVPPEELAKRAQEMAAVQGD